MPGLLTGSTTGIMDRQKGKGSAESSFLQRIGRSSAQAAGSGNIAALVSAGINPASTGADFVLASWTIPANLFDISGRGFQLTAMGGMLNATSKTVKIIAGATTAVVGSAVTGGTTIATTGAVTLSGGWQISAQVFKYGNPGSNTQVALHQASVVGATNSALTAPSLLTLTESSSFLLCVTGNAATAGDLTLNFAEVFATN